MQVKRVLILDGYTDEPAGFGVPPYLDVLPRYIAGALWTANKSITIRYVTIDEARKDLTKFLREAEDYDIVVVVAGAIVPGRYLGGEPIRLEELKLIASTLKKPVKILAGACAKWGIGNVGGGRVRLPTEVETYFDVLVKGDVEQYFYDLAREGIEGADPTARLEDEKLLHEAAWRGAHIVKQHPNYGYNLVAEIETFRGCPRWVSGGCSFCVTKLYRPPLVRKPESIIREVEELYRLGVRHIRIGRQADILVYGSKGLNEGEEWPRPNPAIIEKLFYGIRQVAPSLKTLHIDNANPGTIARYPEESRRALKAIVKYHTPGDVAALGIETADPKVVKANNLKVYPDEALEAIRIINEVGKQRGYNGLPELLPGINFVLGLIGETRETYKLNEEFLERIVAEGLLVRRINVRKVLALPGTRMWEYGDTFIKRHYLLAKRFEQKALEIGKIMLKRLVPPGTILKGLYVETYSKRYGVTYARQAGTYPLVAEIPCRIEPPCTINVVVYGYAGRSVRALPVPLDANKTPITILSKVVGRDKAIQIARLRPIQDSRQLARMGIDTRLVDVKGYQCSPS